MPAGSDDRFADLVVSLGHVTPEQVEAARRAIEEASDRGQALFLGQTLVKLGHLTPAAFAEVGRRLRGLGETLAEGAPVGGEVAQRVGPYTVLEEIGRGGMGVVYRARHEGSGREVALKVLVDRAGSDPERLARFEREGRVVAALEHPHLIRIDECGRDGQTSYIAMELVEGPSLEGAMAAGPLSRRRAVELIETVARAIDHAHEGGVIHRDLKPGNILLAADGPRVADFGLAMLVDDDDRLTRTGVPMGSPRYMSPEQAAGRRREVDRRSDVFSLGAILYELLVGKPPFTGRSIGELFHAIETADPLPPRRVQPTVPRPLEAVCLRALARSPDDRYPTALALAEDLRRVREREHVTTSLRIRRRGRRPGPGLVGAIVAVAAVVVLVCVLAVVGRGDPSPVEPAGDWATPRQAFAETLAVRDYDGAARHLAALEEAGAPPEVAATVRQEMLDSISIQFRVLVADGYLAEAGALLEIGRASDLDGDSLDGLRRAAIDLGVSGVRQHLDGRRFGEARAAVEALRLALGDDPVLTELADWAAGRCRVEVRAAPGPATVPVRRWLADSGRPAGEERPLGDGGLEVGDHLIEVAGPDGRAVAFPVRLERDPDGRPAPLAIDLDLARTPEGMAFVPGGPAAVGSPEEPATVDLPALLVDRTEVPRTDYARFLASLAAPFERTRRLPYFNVYDPEAYVDPMTWTGLEPDPAVARLPVTGITRDDARLFAVRAGKRLPTEPEWEKAARWVDGRVYPWGDSFEPSRALVAGASRARPGEVGSWPAGASPYGVLDLCGNVREWTETPAEGGRIVVKGGSFLVAADRSRAFDRTLERPTGSYPDIGFRCVRTHLVARGESEILAALTSSDDGVRTEAARLAGLEAPSPALAEALLARLEDPDDFVWRIAVESLVAHRTVAVVEAIEDRVDRLDGPLHRRALAALVRVAPSDRLDRVAARLATLDDRSSAYLMDLLLARHEPVAVEAYSRVFESAESETVRFRAAALLAALGDRAGRDHLLRLAAGPVGDWKEWAARRLAWIGDPSALVPLFELAHAAPDRIAQANLNWLLAGVLRGEGVGEALSAGLGDEAPGVRLECARFLGLRGERAAAGRLERLAASDADEAVRTEARRALERLGR